MIFTIEKQRAWRWKIPHGHFWVIKLPSLWPGGGTISAEIQYRGFEIRVQKRFKNDRREIRRYLRDQGLEQYR